MPPSTSSTALRLHMVLSHGLYVSVVFPLQAGRSVTMAEVLAQGPPSVSQDQQEAAEQCRLRSDGALPDDGGLWWLENHSAELSCMLNHRRLAQGERARLNEGDVLEVGLTRFIIESSPTAHTDGRRVQQVAQATDVRHGQDEPEASTARTTEIYGGFSLTDLMQIELTGNPAGVFTQVGTALPKAGAPGKALQAGAPGKALPGGATGHAQGLHGRASRQLIDAHENPFNDIGDVAYRLDVLPAKTEDALGVSNALANLRSLSSSQGQGTERSSPVATAADETESPAVLRHLHAEYLRLMRNPHESPAHDWSIHGHQAGHPANDVLEDLTQRANAYTSLYGLLGENESIGSIMAGLDVLNDQNILGPEMHVDVLRLFAPDDLMMHEGGLAGLTRREHHILTADSAADLDRGLGPQAPLPARRGKP